MSIAMNQIITWSDFTDLVINSIKSVCSNIDNVNNVPSYLRSGTGNVNVRNISTSVGGGGQAQTFRYYAVPVAGTLIKTVTSSTITSEWTSFLNSAGINARSNKIISAYDFTMATALCQQFMSYHLKPVYYRGCIYGANQGWTGTKYLTDTDLGAACSPKSSNWSAPWNSSGIPATNVPDINNGNINGRYGIIRESIFHDYVNYGIITNENNPVVYRCYLGSW